VEDLVAKLGNAAADLGADLDDRLVHLALDVLTECRGARGQELADVRPQFPRVRVDDLELFLHANGEPMRHGSS
jgi:hypothetical protein